MNIFNIRPKGVFQGSGADYKNLSRFIRVSFPFSSQATLIRSMNTIQSLKVLILLTLNQNPYDYTVEVRHRFKGLDMIDLVADELWTEVHETVQETRIKTIPMEKKCKKAK